MRSRTWKLVRLAAPLGLIPLFACLSPPVESPNTTVTQETSVRVEQSVKNKVDLLFLIDNSPSMAPKQNELRNRFPQLIKALDTFAAQGNPASYHIGVVNSDLGAGPFTLNQGQCHPGGDGAKLQVTPAANAQLPAFATGLNGPCYALRIRSNGEVMVACTSQVYRLDAAGNVIQTYTLPGGFVLFALNLDPDGTSFWTADLDTGQIWHVDIATGAVINTFTSNVNSQLAGLAIVGELRAAVDTTPPTCTLTSTLAGPPKEIQVTVQDTGSGLASIVPTTVNATATVPVFAPGSTSAQLVIADKTDQSKPSSLTLKVTDVSGNSTTCDPWFGLSQTKTVGVLPVRFTHLLGNAATVVVRPLAGVRSVDLLVNGRLFHVAGLRPGNSTRVNIGAALRVGGTNVVVAKARGKHGALANVMITD